MFNYKFIFFSCFFLCPCVIANGKENNITPPIFFSWPFSPFEANERVNETAQFLCIPKEKILNLGGEVFLGLRLIPAGKFLMGIPKPEKPKLEIWNRNILVCRVIFWLGICGFIFFIIYKLKKSKPIKLFISEIIVLHLLFGLIVGGFVKEKNLFSEYNNKSIEFEMEKGFYENFHDPWTISHHVTISKPFYMGKNEVTQEQFNLVMGYNPSRYKSSKKPVESVTWDEAVVFCQKLSDKVLKKIRIPTEAEWEYACRSGSEKSFFFGSDFINLGQFDWFCNNSNGAGTQDVEKKNPNYFGLFDIHGNVREWCFDFFSPFNEESQVDPIGPLKGKKRVARGGSWSAHPGYCFSAIRYSEKPDTRQDDIGFRVVLEIY